MPSFQEYLSQVPFHGDDEDFNSYLEGARLGYTANENNQEGFWRHADLRSSGTSIGDNMRIFPKVDYPTLLSSGTLPEGYKIPTIEDLPKLDKVDMSPKPKKGGSLKGMAGVAGGIVGGIGNKLISQGFSSGAGNAVAGIGGTVGSAVSMVNPVLGGIISAASGIVGGGLNRLTGSKMNNEGIANINARIANNSAVAGSLAKASTTDDLMDKWSNLNTSTQINQSDVGKDGIWGNKAKKKRKALERGLATASASAGQGLYLGEKNVANTQQDLVDSNFKYAYGGDMGAIDYNFMSDLTRAKLMQSMANNKISGISPMPAFNGFAEGGVIYPGNEMQAADTMARALTLPSKEKYTAKDYANVNVYQDNMGNLFSIAEDGSRRPIDKIEADRMVDEFNRMQKRSNVLERVKPNSKYLKALGGLLQSHGGDWSNGLMAINSGGTHEENPNEGVQLGVDREGVPNLVEEGETIFNDYVFSKRILADGGTLERFKLPKKKKISFADLSIYLTREGEERKMDPLSNAAIKIQLTDLANEQERQKLEMEAQRAQEAFSMMPPENQIAMMDQAEAQQQEAAMQEQAMQEQMAQQSMMQPYPDQMNLMQAAQQQDMMQQQMPQEAQYMGAYGGRINRFDTGGFKTPEERRAAVYKALGLYTNGDWEDFIGKYGDASQKDFLLNDIWNDENFYNNEYLRNAISKSGAGPAFNHALSSGYNFSPYNPTPTNLTEVSIDTHGMWGNTNPKDWVGSQDKGYLEIKDSLPENATVDDLINAFKSSKAFNATTEWLKANPENIRMYLNAVLKSGNKQAIAYAKKFVNDDGTWRKDLKDEDKNYQHIIYPKREDKYPGTYWKSVNELTGEPIEQNFFIDDKGNVTRAYNINPEWAKDNTYEWGNNRYNYYKAAEEKAKEAAAEEEAEAANPNKRNILAKHRNENLRYLSAFKPAVGMALQLAGVGKPSTAMLDGALSSVSGGNALARSRPIGNYLTYRPEDIALNQNVADASARATDRALTNAAGAGVAGNVMTGLLANEYNRQLGTGEIARNARMYNDTLAKQVGEFNRGTDQFNADAFNKVSMANAEMLNKNRQTNAQLAMQAAGQKIASDLAWSQGLYGNIGGIFQALGDIGRDNAAFNSAADLWASGVLGGATPDHPLGRNYLKYADEEKKSQSKYGGKLKKRRGGLTI